MGLGDGSWSSGKWSAMNSSQVGATKPDDWESGRGWGVTPIAAVVNGVRWTAYTTNNTQCQPRLVEKQTRRQVLQRIFPKTTVYSGARSQTCVATGATCNGIWETAAMSWFNWRWDVPRSPSLGCSAASKLNLVRVLKKTGSLKRIGQSAEVELAKTLCRQRIGS